MCGVIGEESLDLGCLVETSVEVVAIGRRGSSHCIITENQVLQYLEKYDPLECARQAAPEFKQRSSSQPPTRIYCSSTKENSM